MDYFQIKCLPQDPLVATKDLLDKILNEIHPQIIRTRNNIQSCTNEEDTSKIRDVYTLCLSQIKKCILSLFEVFRLEYYDHMLLQETRQCLLERLMWCFNRLGNLDKHLERTQMNADESCDNSFNVTIMYFVNWIDHAFDVLNKLSELVYKTDYKDDDQLFNQWKSDMVECVSGLHLSVDELLLSAMTLCRYCLPSDQLIVKARSQVVLRETKALLSELIDVDLSAKVEATTETLKVPVMPSNVNVMIDVLKDVLNILETNTNTALLTLLVHCFSTKMSPVEILKEHFMDATKGDCSCAKTTDEEDCSFVREFDLFNERLLQIGSFAVSCSSDQNRILTLRSGLASLEALDPHVVPALMTSPRAPHSALLVDCWSREVREIRDSVFLIVDPAAFADKAKQMMHQKLVEVLKEPAYNNVAVCRVIDIGCVVDDFFDVYNELEPDALVPRDQLIPLLADVHKVQMECKVVSNLLCSGDGFRYNIQTPKQKEATLEQLYKRLKLLYTLIKTINGLLQPKENNHLFDGDQDVPLNNVTHTIVNNGQTYVHTACGRANKSSTFARTCVRSSTRNPLSKLTKHLRGKNRSQLNFSVELDRIFNLSDDNVHSNSKYLSRAREASVLYNFSPINRSNMRKAVLKRRLATIDKEIERQNNGPMESLMNENESLQLTEVLNEMNNMTSILVGKSVLNRTQTVTEGPRNILTINVNQNATITKHIWNIPVNSAHAQTDVSGSSSYQPSTVTTLERINDLDFVESKLYTLKSQFETTL